MPMIELGQKEKDYFGSPVSAKESQSKMIYPSFSVNKEIPVDEKLIGKEMTAVCKLKLRSLSKRSDTNGKKFTCGFDILSINLNPSKGSHYVK